MEEEDDIFKMPTREKLEETICTLLFRLYGDVYEETETEVFVTDISGNTENENTELSFKERIKKKINEASAPKTADGHPTKRSIQSEMSHYELTKKLGENLEKLLMVLKNIAPTSVYAEQAFSVAGSFIPNRRSRLSDVSIDNLCFEKAYFDNDGY